MTSEEIRQSFLEFFKDRGHVMIPSSSLMPDDPSVLLTTAGMQQFKLYYTGELSAMSDFGSQRAVSSQKCFRTSDIEEVGDETHLTFFEMLGNFSFGPVGSDDPDISGKDGYFKRAAIHWAYEYITEVLEIETDKIFVTVFEGDKETAADKESYRVWYDEIGMPKERIKNGNRTDNFWGPTGNEGPCGPTTEIYVAKTVEDALAGNGVEIWNLVFNEYFKDREGKFEKLENPGVDTGMGFERVVSIMQGTSNVYETDIFKPLVLKISELVPGLPETALRVLADHLRASAFLIADGVRPSNKETGYILRRLLRRIMAYEVKYDIHADLFLESVKIVAEKFGGVYPEVKNTKIILEVMEEEKQKFQAAVSRGVKEIEKMSEITGKEAFYLYETLGLPYELVLELAPAKATHSLRKEDFDREFESHQEVSRAGAEKKFGGHGLVLDTGELKAGSEEEMKKVIRLHTVTHLLHWTLREVLGEEVHQMGSDINPERTRFDFSFNRKMTPEEIKEVENLVNEKIKSDLPVYYKEMPKSEAEKTGALHFFKQKYPDMVKVYFIGSEPSGGIVSSEFCGGPHVEHTLEIGNFKIIKEEAVGAGVRRIRASVS